MAIGLDASLPLRRDNYYGFYSLNKTVKDNMRQKVKMLMLTAPGERIMLPNYGVGLRHYLFENSPEFQVIERIREQVSLFLRDISIVSLEVNKGTNRMLAQMGQKHILSVEFIYLINGTDLEDTLNLVETKIL
mgnify:CR=1 FL=1|tara:strand:- start:9706 stop:10104 length:399 start_codon:yes stop_codon:yes gene_type:complete